MKHQSLETQLKTFDFFGEIEGDILKDVLPFFRIQEFKNGELIIQEDEKSNAVYFILEGAVKVLSYTPSGEMVYFRRQDVGEMFGMIAALAGIPRMASVYAIGKTTLAILEGETFKKLVLDNKKLSEKIIQTLLRVLEDNTERIKSRSTLSAEKRVYAELLSSAAKENSYIIFQPLKQNEWAAKLDMTRETLSRCLNKLEHQDIITRNSTQIIIKDIEKLKSLFNEKD